MDSRPIRQLSREEASRLLYRRATRLGAALGLLLAFLWTFGLALLSEAFPPIGDPFFFLFLFIATIVLGAAGWFAAKRWATKLLERSSGP